MRVVTLLLCAVRGIPGALIVIGLSLLDIAFIAAAAPVELP